MKSIGQILIIQDPANPDPHVAAYQEVAEAMQGAIHDLQGIKPRTIYGRIPTERGNAYNIVFGAQHAPRLGVYLDPGSILYNMEQVGSPWFTPEVIELYKRFKYDLWDYSAANAARFPELGLPVPTVVPFGWHQCLERIERKPEAERDIDVLHVGSMNARRAKILDELESRGLKVVRLFGVYGKERDDYYARTKVVVNIHYYESAIFEAARCNYLVANKVFVASEESTANEGKDIVSWYGPYSKIVEDVEYFVRFDGIVATAEERRTWHEFHESQHFKKKLMADYLRAVL